MLKLTGLKCEYRENAVGLDEPHPRISWRLESEESCILQASYRIQVARETDFEHIIWDTGIVKSAQSIHVTYEGPQLQPRTRYYFRVRVRDTGGSDSGWSQTSFWETGLMETDLWTADWIRPVPDSKSTGEACPMLRKTFAVSGKIKRARVYSTALGLYELCINGKRVGDWLFTPGWTNYRKRLQYQTYDVTDLLKPGANAIGAILGKGWFSGNLVWKGNNNIYGDSQALLFQMYILYEDGSEDTVLSDNSWKSSSSPILMSEIYHGETYDARFEKSSWNRPEYNASGWDAVELYEYDKSILTAQENVPVRITRQIKPAGLVKTPAGETVIDFGQNMTGWVRFCAAGEAGTHITLKHAEVLDSQGNFYTENLRSAKQTVTYIMKGEGVECFEPHFTFQGFRYVSVDGYPGEIQLENFTGMVIHSDMEETGSFECSNVLVNQLQHNIQWSQRGNFLDIPTDCPQRDERLGWTGDAQMFIRTACFNMNTALFFTKWLKDLYSEQSPDKGVPHVIPNVLGDGFSSAAWGDAAVICPWTIYLCYGDERILRNQYDSMKMWVEYIKKQGDNPYLWNTGSHFGDWLGLDSKDGTRIGATSREYIATAFYAYSTAILARAAAIIGRQEDATLYGKLYLNIVASFRKKYVKDDGNLKENTQTAHVLALMFELVEEKHRKRTADALAGLIRKRGNHLATGFVGTPYLCHVLGNNGYSSLAYELLLRTDYPSWLYQITKGATTIWEHWDGIGENGSFWSSSMNSFNHYAYGAIGDWLYRAVAGIDTDEGNPGYRHIIIRPCPGSGLTYARASLKTMYGEIRSGWEKTSEGMRLQIMIPPNTTATVMLPGALLKNVKESGQAASASRRITECRQTDEGASLELGSGVYDFLYDIRNCA